MYTNPDVVRATMVKCNITHMVVMDIAGAKVGSADCSDGAALVDQFNYYLMNAGGAMRVEAWRDKDSPATGGPPSKSREAYKWIVMAEGVAIAPKDAPVAPVASGPVVDVAAQVRLAVLELELNYLKRERDALLEDDGADEDEGAPVPVPTLAAQVKEVLPLVTDALRVLFPRTAPGAVITGVPGAVSKDRELLAALDELAQKDPEGFAQQRAAVMAMYGPKQPTPDESK